MGSIHQNRNSSRPEEMFGCCAGGHDRGYRCATE